MFQRKGKKLLILFRNISEANVNMDAKKPLGIETIDKRKSNACRPLKVTKELQTR